MNEPVRRLGKRWIDLVCASLGLVFASPVLIATAISIRVTMGRPVIFRQARPGLYGEPFTILKFRTMRNAIGPDGRLLSDAERLTPFGAFLRRSSIDELPELWNVFRGNMSLVGPRPLMPEYLGRYTAEQMRRHETLPGITGWAQVNGRNALDWPEKLSLDVWYVDNWSLALDLRILVRTLWQVLRRKGISFAGHPTMPEFLGNESRVDIGR